jgi:hypothetical protein
MKRSQRVLYIALALGVLALALGLRLRAVRLLPIDYDEDDYLGAAQRYAQFLAAGDVRGLVDYAYNYEHPPLSKLAYGLAILPLPEAPLLPEGSSTLPPAGTLPQPHMRVARTVSAVLGALEALALAFLNPLAGLFLAIHTWQIKYTSQIMLEPLPSLMSALAVLFYYRAMRAPAGNRRASRVWLILSGIALGLTAASKYTYCVAGLAIAADFGLRLLDRGKVDARQAGAQQAGTRELLLWGLISLAVFFAANPRMWSDPLGRLAQSLLYHGDYAQSAHVRQYNFPFWQPLVWLLGPVPWHPGVFVVALDTLIAILAGLGLGRLWRRYRVFALWLAVGFGFLLIWPTKWPQYILTITVPVCLAAAEGFQGMLWDPLTSRLVMLIFLVLQKTLVDRQLVGPVGD